MSEQELAAIEARANAATPMGTMPWVLDGDNLASYFDDYATVADLAFVAHVRKDVPALVAEVRRLRSALVLIEDKAAQYETWARYEQRGRQADSFALLRERARKALT